MGVDAQRGAVACTAGKGEGGGRRGG
jgi:hypothetical protein